MFLFSLIFIMRLPTLFNDYYDVDELAAICQARDYLAGDIPGVDFSESKKPLYHLIFKGAYSLSMSHGWVIVHVVTIFFIFVTSLFLYLIGRRVDCENTGLVSAMLYGVLISSFNRQFMATNGEVIYNLFLAAGLLLFIISIESEKIRRVLSFAAAVVMGLCAWQVKFHGIILILFMAFFIVIYIPYIKFGLRNRYFLFLFISGFSLMGLILVLKAAGFKPAGDAVAQALSLLYYASSPGRNFTIADLLIRFFHRQTLIGLWHFVLWVPAALIIFRFVKFRFKGKGLSESAVILFALITYLMIFGGGARIYFHYYMAAYPFLSIAAAMAINNPNFYRMDVFRRKFTLLLAIPGLFFFLWNMKDIYIRHFAQQAFYNEGRVLYWTRAVLAGTFNHYLLPGKEYLETVNYIRNNTGSSDRLFVWGDGPYLNYFADRRQGGTGLWMKNTAYRIKGYYDIGTAQSLEQAAGEERGLVAVLERKKPELIVDVSGNGLSGFRVPLSTLKVLNKYISTKYRKEKNINGFEIYRRVL